MPKTEQKNEKTLQFGVRKLVKQNYSQILSIRKIALSHMNIEFTKPESIYFRVELVLNENSHLKLTPVVRYMDGWKSYDE